MGLKTPHRVGVGNRAGALDNAKPQGFGGTGRQTEPAVELDHFMAAFNAVSGADVALTTLNATKETNTCAGTCVHIRSSPESAHENDTGSL